jgi:hypothetical protein
MSKKYNTRYEYTTERLVNWLSDFADKQGQKILQDESLYPKSANYTDNILNIINRKKNQTIEEKVAHYRELVGLDQLEKIEKEGEQEQHKTASRFLLSMRDKIAQENTVMDSKQLMEKIKEYVVSIVKNRNGVIAMPAIIEQLEHYMKVDREWMIEHYEEIESIITQAKKDFSPQEYDTLSVDMLTKSDNRVEKEPPLFVPPTKS